MHELPHIKCQGGWVDFFPHMLLLLMPAQLRILIVASQGYFVSSAGNQPVQQHNEITCCRVELVAATLLQQACRSSSLGVQA